MKKFINPNDLGKPTGYSHAVRVGNTIFVSGQTAMNEKGQIVGESDLAKQTEQAFHNLEKALHAAGANLKDVVKLNIYSTDQENYYKIRDVRAKYFPSNPPAGTGVIVKGLALKELMVEIDAIAVIE